MCAIKADDVIGTLQQLGLVQNQKGQHVVCAAPKLIEKFLKQVSGREGVGKEAGAEPKGAACGVRSPYNQQEGPQARARCVPVQALCWLGHKRRTAELLPMLGVPVAWSLGGVRVSPNIESLDRYGKRLPWGVGSCRLVPPTGAHQL